ncbi:uncharacterized protein MYCGRDRAFT_95850 [Zymoseptoria tritici IPO323]|uniref:Uncharacterized protein n=1 Tax=Zymoseptoria tritici (strain CBS 115943 / IPO323) TaxID=336722 RepID=F9XJK4_ZYMTI|nr:uncharacterized protein MYCGRDRAFT_95850 [Zymoseptoria tritici IPO323]EGP84620.1 hypothetical protein MYCGRDRAFT_95850 [Zymoseptoria tritici IPO323]
MPTSPSQNTWLARLAVTALLCAWILTILPYLQNSPSHSPPRALHPRANDANLTSHTSSLPISYLDPLSAGSSNVTKRDFMQCDWATAALSAAVATLGDVNPDELDPCAKMVFRGTHLLCIMNSQADRVQQSTWVDLALDISTYGWNRLDNYRSFDLYGLRSSFEALNINDDNAHRKEAMMEQSSDSRPDPTGPEYEASGGEYVWSFNPSDGAMVALSSYSPDYMAATFQVEPPIVPLKRWSDLTFLTWRALFANPEDARGLKHVFRHDVANEASQDGMKSILGRDEEVSETFPGPWPGVSFSTGEAQGLAALTLPNTVGVVWLLAQHKLQLGIRVIEQVHIFTCPKPVDGREIQKWCLYLHIVDGPIGPGL